MLWAFLGLLAIFVAGGISFAIVGTPWKGRVPKLTVWHRTAVVLSIIWAIGFYLLWLSYRGAEASAYMRANYDICGAGGPAYPAYERCVEQAHGVARSMNQTALGDAALVSGALILAVWIAAYMALWAARWIMRGRAKEKNAHA